MPEAIAATATFSSTLTEPNGFISWNVRTMPARATLCGAKPVMSRPSSITVPACGAMAPATRLNRVVFPAPLGPMMPRMLPSCTSKETSSTAFSPWNARLTLRTSSRLIAASTDL